MVGTVDAREVTMLGIGAGLDEKLAGLGTELRLDREVLLDGAVILGTAGFVRPDR